jgi:hypothetical protein
MAVAELVGCFGLQDGTRPVHLAAWKGHDSVLKLLLLKGGDFRVTPPRPFNSLCPSSSDRPLMLKGRGLNDSVSLWFSKLRCCWRLGSLLASFIGKCWLRSYFPVAEGGRSKHVFPLC